MYLLPKPQKMNLNSGFLQNKVFYIKNSCKDPRIEKALQKLPCSLDGILLEISDCGKEGENYVLDIQENHITLEGNSPAGVFYGIQTLRQLLENETIPCLIITDFPGFSYRGFYHDVTRGKIPTVETLKSLIDQMAYYKMNSLQIYVEHVFPFKEFGEYAEINGYLTPEEIMELDEYCYDNFIEFIPSIATFGHLYELLQQDKFKDLQELENFTEDQLYWFQRMAHHTIDPTDPRSIEIIKSMIDQYLPLFRTNKFNICCDETFDLTNGKHRDLDTGRLYIDFVKKIVEHLQSKGKQIMMWADILLQHPETIHELPEGIEFLNWNYEPKPDERQFETFGHLDCTQIVCPGTNSWSRLIEGMDSGSRNILNVGKYGYKYHAKGMLNTNWGDYGNPCSLELAMHGLVLGAALSWNEKTEKNADFTSCINHLLYKNEKAVQYLNILDQIQDKINWNDLSYCYSNCIYDKKFDVPFPTMEDIKFAQKECSAILHTLQKETWTLDEYRQEILLTAEGLMVIAELFAKFAGYQIENKASAEKWMEKFSQKWMEKNKKSELYRIQDMFAELAQA